MKKFKQKQKMKFSLTADQTKDKFKNKPSRDKL